MLLRGRTRLLLQTCHLSSHLLHVPLRILLQVLESLHLRVVRQLIAQPHSFLVDPSIAHLFEVRLFVQTSCREVLPRLLEVPLLPRHLFEFRVQQVNFLHLLLAKVLVVSVLVLDSTNIFFIARTRIVESRRGITHRSACITSRRSSYQCQLLWGQRR